MKGPERIPHQEEIFPINPDTLQDGVDWAQAYLSYPMRRDREIEFLEKKEPSLYSFIQDMKTIRKLSSPKEKIVDEAYENGALFMSYLFRVGYKNTGMKIPEISSDLKLNYVLDLMDIENNRYEIINLTKKNTSENDSESFQCTEIAERINNSKGRARRRVLTSFHDNSSEKLYSMHEKEELLGKTLRHEKFVEAYGPIESLNLGALDIYEIISLKEDLKPLENMWDVDIR